MNRPCLLVTGNGLLAHAAVKWASLADWDVRIVASSVTPSNIRWRVDLSDSPVPPEALTGADMVLHTFAFTSVAGCEQDPERAEQLNVETTRRLHRQCVGAGVDFLFPSTDWVFDGRGGPYVESDPVSPVNAYGRSKAMAEASVVEDGGLVIRGAFLGPRGAGQTGLLELLGSAPRPAVGRSRISNPLHVDRYVSFALRLAQQRRQGIVHLGSATSMSWRDLCARIRHELTGDHLVDDAPDDSLARPHNTTLDARVATQLLGEPMPSMAATIDMCIATCQAIQDAHERRQ